MWCVADDMNECGLCVCLSEGSEVRGSLGRTVSHLHLHLSDGISEVQ